LCVETEHPRIAHTRGRRDHAQYEESSARKHQTTDDTQRYVATLRREQFGKATLAAKNEQRPNGQRGIAAEGDVPRYGSASPIGKRGYGGERRDRRQTRRDVSVVGDHE